MMTIGLVAKRQLFAPFVYKNDHITKTGSGQTQGKLREKRVAGIAMVNCSDVAAPFHTSCSTGAAKWMTTEGPAAAAWSQVRKRGGCPLVM